MLRSAYEPGGREFESLRARHTATATRAPFGVSSLVIDLTPNHQTHVTECAARTGCAAQSFAVGTLWIVIVAGHVYAGLNGQAYFASHASCINTATVVGGQCVQMSTLAQQPPNDSGASHYQQCIAFGACQPLYPK